MITGNIQNAVAQQEKKFEIAMAFLRREDLRELPEGWYELGEGVRASVQRYVSMEKETLSFETHDKFYDVQYVVEGREFVGVCSRKGLVVKKEYDEENDITFYEEPELSGWVLLEAGEYVVLSPEDVHKPRCLAGEAMPVVKIVVKVPV